MLAPTFPNQVSFEELLSQEETGNSANFLTETEVRALKSEEDTFSSRRGSFSAVSVSDIP